MVQKLTDSAYVSLLMRSYGRELIMNEIARVRELDDKERGAMGLRPEDLDALDMAINEARGQFHLMHPKRSGLHGILFKLFRGKVPDISKPRDGALVIDKVFERIGASDVEAFISALEGRGDLSSVALDITGINFLRARFLNDTLILGRKYFEDYDTRLYAVTAPKFSGSGGDIMAFDLSKIRRIELSIVSRAFSSPMTFYAQGKRRLELMKRVATLNPNCPPVAQRPDEEGSPSSDGSDSSGGTSGPGRTPSSGNEASSFSGIARNTPAISPETPAEIYPEARLVDPDSFFDSNPTGAGAALFMSLMAKPVS
jgi:hypothetical protein